MDKNVFVLRVLPIYIFNCTNYSFHFIWFFVCVCVVLRTFIAVARPKTKSSGNKNCVWAENKKVETCIQRVCAVLVVRAARYFMSFVSRELYPSSVGSYTFFMLIKFNALLFCTLTALASSSSLSLSSTHYYTANLIVSLVEFRKENETISFRRKEKQNHKRNEMQLNFIVCDFSSTTTTTTDMEKLDAK